MIVFWHAAGCPFRANFQAKRKFFSGTGRVFTRPWSGQGFEEVESRPRWRGRYYIGSFS